MVIGYFIAQIMPVKGLIFIAAFLSVLHPVSLRR